MIELQGIHRQFQVGEQTVHAVKGIDLSIARGEYVSVMGPTSPVPGITDSMAMT